MAFWSQDIKGFAESLLPGRPFQLLDDILSLVVVSLFSVVEAHISLRLLRYVKVRTSSRNPQSSRIFGFVSIALGAGYLVYTINSIAMFCLKLEFVTDLINTGQRSALVDCPEGYTQFDSTPFCMEISKALLPRSVKTAGVFNEVLLYLMILLSDGLLIYRCHILLETRRLIFFIACTPLLISFMYYLVTTATFRANEHYQTSSVLIGIYVSLLANLVVSTTLFVWLWKARRAARSKHGHSSSGGKQATIPYTRLMRILLESAIPPLILGIIHLILRLASFEPIIPGLGILWVSVTVLAPQYIALRAFQVRDQRLRQEGVNHTDIPSHPIAFRMTESNMSTCVEMVKGDDSKYAISAPPMKASLDASSHV
ncbi:hypothetical protein BKA70DRAFT_273223 [Coprinopsis sp. MPI-PUGE-AT-0042]|nr:hypothetical protein BKA70DRAFT_273223 [Coprinopsis sp. MPI-PUGE-AT-0042]